MQKTDLHMHTYYCDGHDSPEEMVLSGIAKGQDTVGILHHSYTPYDMECGIAQEDIPAFIDEVHHLKEKYKDKINVLCGVEEDYYSKEDTTPFDYVIGSIHYMKFGEDYPAIDLDYPTLKKLVDDHFGGDFYKFAEAYYEMEEHLVEKTHATIVGHFDLVSKFNDHLHFFDENNERYVKAWKKAVDTLLKKNVIFEINTGGISRGHKDFPYPSREMIAYIRDHGGKLLLSSDAHKKEDIAAFFDQYGF